MTARAKDRVRYVSPFGSPATMPREEAERYLDQDDRLYVFLQQLEAEGAGKMLTDRQRQIGPPRIER